MLHEAARRKDLTLIELAVRGGADVFVRDRRGRTVSSVVGKDDKVRVFLRQCECLLYYCFVFVAGRMLILYLGKVTNQDMTLLDEKPATEQIELKGYLNK